MAQPPEQDSQPTHSTQRPAIVQVLAVGLVVAVVVLLLRGLLTPAIPGSARSGHTAPGGGVALATATPAPAAPLVGHYAPNVTLPDLHDKPVSIASLRGSVVLLNFWYASCLPCQIEMPGLEHTYQAHASQGFTVVGIDVTDSVQDISAFTTRLGISYPILREDAGRAQLAYEVRALPSSFLIDRAGVIRAIYAGPLNSSNVAQQLAALLPPP
jgi:cytochrome c biogenesis protein CcmG, thiol:disulfide interchange protein DsbE